MSIKLIVTDMDGTLLNADHATISPRNIAAFRAASARGVKLAFASGRTWSLLIDAAEQVGVLDYAILSNGAVVMEVGSGRRLYERCIPNEKARLAIDFLQDQDINFEVYIQGQNYMQPGNGIPGIPGLEAKIPKLIDICRRRSAVVPDLKEALGDWDMEKTDLYIPPEQREEIYAELSTLIPIGPSSSGAPDGMEYNLQGTNKGLALQTLAKLLGLQPDEVMAFGDGENDVEMLTWAGWSFAMKNGTAAAKAAARYIAPLNDEGGVGQMIEKYVLN